MEVVFLSVEDAIYIQEQEAILTNSPTLVRSREALESAVAAPQASFDGHLLMDIFEMAASYIVNARAETTKRIKNRATGDRKYGYP